MNGFTGLMLDQKLLSLEKPVIMGILNVTPDSFYAGSRRGDIEEFMKTAAEMLEEGATILDVGACSTRPGADPLSADEEKKRLREPLAALRERFPSALISVDTFRSEVAAWCIENFNVRIVNDVSGGTDPEMARLVAETNCGYVLTHSRGDSRTMQSLSTYGDVAAEVLSWLAFRLDKLRAEGASNVIVDPGFGFAKTLDQNYRLLGCLEAFQSLEAPILAGVSRKSMITKAADCGPEDALPGTIALNTLALMKGARILRVHDVRETLQVIKVMEKLWSVSE